MAPLSPALSAPEVAVALARLADWDLANGSLVREFSFPGFPDALRFVNDVAALAERAGHHPDIDIRYSKVKLALVTHDAGGITQRDFDLATAIDGIHQNR